MSSAPKPFLPTAARRSGKPKLPLCCRFFLTQGPAVPAFERAVAARVDARHGVAVNSATSALPIDCLALGMVLGPGGRLWTHPITLVASANCSRYCGAAVDFVDIDPTTLR